MSNHQASAVWQRGDESFLDNRYSREHRWEFDEGVSVAASSSPSNVPLPYSVEAAVDPEEALVAATSSCHMLWFLSLAAKKGWCVDSYRDNATGVMGKDELGRTRFLEIVLAPRIKFDSSGGDPSQNEIEAVHELAHEKCFIANSLRCAVRVEMVG